MNKELWIKIAGFENYEVSNYGRVRSLDRSRKFYGRRGSETHAPVKGRILKCWKKRHGYMCIYLCNGKPHVFMVHRLVAQAFLGLDIRDRGVEVGHRDNDPSNNKTDNLYLTTHRENEDYKVICKRTIYGERNKSAKLKEHQVLDIYKKYKKGSRICELEREYDHKGIADIVHGVTWKYLYKDNFI